MDCILFLSYLCVNNKTKQQPLKSNDMYYVVRDTYHPAEDVKRNWSAFAGGSETGESGGATAEEAAENYAAHNGTDVDDVTCEFRYHPAYEQFVAVDYEGLGAEYIEADTLEDAIECAANNFNGNLAETFESGSGHFFAEDVVSYHEVREGRYIFVVNDIAE